MAKGRSYRGEEPQTLALGSALSRFLARGLNRLDAAAYVGVSTTFFDEMVRDGRMPQPKMAGSRVLWDRTKLDAYFGALPERGADADEARDSWADFQ